jgi:hypothetical protein
MDTRAKVLVIIAAALVAAAAARADVGSVVSSFRMTGVGATAAKGIYRGDTYVYAVVDTATDNYLRLYTTSGSIVGSVVLAGSDSPRDADHSPLGSGYLDVFDYGRKMLVTYGFDGSVVRSKAVPSDTTAYAYIPGTQRYFLARDQMIFRYTLNDVLINKFYVGGTLEGLAASGLFDGRAGQYVVVGRSGTGGFTYVYTGGGSIVDSFVVPGAGTYGSVVGLGAFMDSAQRYWCVQTVGSYRWAYQLDIGATAPAVTPASVGRIRTLYR